MRKSILIEFPGNEPQQKQDGPQNIFDCSAQTWQIYQGQDHEGPRCEASEVENY